MNSRKPYPSDLTDREWEQLEPLLPKRRDARGAKIQHPRRELLNAILYVTRNGGAWEALPHDLPPYKTVYDYHYKLTQRGVWQRVTDVLRQAVRVKVGRDPHPSVVVLDSQAAKTTEKGDGEVTTRINE